MWMQNWNWAEDAQWEKKAKEPTSNVMGQESPSSMNEDLIAMMGHHNQVKEEHTAGPKEAQ